MLDESYPPTALTAGSISLGVSVKTYNPGLYTIYQFYPSGKWLRDRQLLNIVE